MSFSNLLGIISRPSNRNNRRNAKNAPKTRTLRLESLETRELLAVHTVTTLLDVVSTTDGVTSLREAISAAAAGDTINFRADLIGGTINLDPARGTLTIPKQLTIDAWNLHTAEQSMSVKDHKGITINGSNLNYAATGGTPMVEITTSSTTPTILRGLTFTNSAANGSVFNHDRDGVAIYASSANGASLTIQNCVFTGVKYGSGGVVDFYGHQL